MCLKVCVPQLQCEHGAVQFFRVHRNQPWASSVLMNLMSKQFVVAMERFIKEEGIVFIGKAQEIGS